MTHTSSLTRRRYEWSRIASPRCGCRALRPGRRREAHPRGRRRWRRAGPRPQTGETHDVGRVGRRHQPAEFRIQRAHPYLLRELALLKIEHGIGGGVGIARPRKEPRSLTRVDILRLRHRSHDGAESIGRGHEMSVWMRGRRRRPAGADHGRRLSQVAAARQRAGWSRGARASLASRISNAARPRAVAQQGKPAAHQEQIIHRPIVDLRRRGPRSFGDRFAAERDGRV